jgi:hypothetical protein
MAAKKKVTARKGAKSKSVGSARKGRAAKPTKAETVEVSGGETGVPPLLAGNMPPIKDLIYHMEQIAGYQAKAKTASMAVTKAKNAAKAAGVDLKSIAEGQGLIGMDPLDMATYFRQLQAIMVEKGMPVQIQLFEPKFGSTEAQAKHEGWNDAKADKPPNTVRWPEGTPGYPEYMRSWNDGTRDNTVKRVTGAEDALEEAQD